MSQPCKIEFNLMKCSRVEVDKKQAGAELCQAPPMLRRWLIDYIILYYSIHFMLFYKMNYQSLPKINPTEFWCLGN